MGITVCGCDPLLHLCETLCECNLPGKLRKLSHSYCLKHLAAGSEARTADGEVLAVVLDGCLLQRLEVLLDVELLEGMPGGLEPAVQLFSQVQPRKLQRFAVCTVA